MFEFIQDFISGIISPGVNTTLESETIESETQAIFNNTETVTSTIGTETEVSRSFEVKIDQDNAELVKATQNFLEESKYILENADLLNPRGEIMLKLNNSGLTVRTESAWWNPFDAGHSVIEPMNNEEVVKFNFERLLTNESDSIDVRQFKEGVYELTVKSDDVETLTRLKNEEGVHYVMPLGNGVTKIGYTAVTPSASV